MRKSEYIKLPSLLIGAFLLSHTGASAQALEEQISVEGRYEAEVIPMERLATYPDHFKTTMPVEELSYDLDPTNLRFDPTFSPMPVPFSGSPRWRGYLDAALGSWLNSRLQAGAWILPPTAPWSLGAWVSHQSTSLWRPKEEDGKRFSIRRDYDEAIGLQTAHTFADGRRFQASVDYNLHYFNYFTAPAAPSQTVNHLRAGASLSSSPTASLIYDFDFAASYFSWREFCLGDAGLRPSRETTLHLGASLYNGGAALDASLDAVLNGHGRDYGQLVLTPSYRFKWHSLHVRLGAQAEFTLNAGTKEDPYSFVHVAPKCLFYIPTSDFTWYLRVGGGSRLSTLANLYELTQWQSPYQLSTAPLFSAIDTSVGFNAGPSSGKASGFEGGLELRWRSLDHLPLIGWYPSMLQSGGSGSLEDLLDNAAGSSISGMSVNARLAWSLPGVMRIDLQGLWAPRTPTHGGFAGIDRPEWSASGSVMVTPVSALELSVGADWRGDRRLYSHSGSLALPDWFSLSARASWRFSERFSAGVTASNLTGRDNLILPGVPAEGLSAAATLSLLF